MVAFNTGATFFSASKEADNRRKLRRTCERIFSHYAKFRYYKHTVTV